MARRINLVELLNIPNTAICPTCGKEVEMYFDEYHLESHDSSKPGTFSCTIDCPHCQETIDQNYQEGQIYPKIPQVILTVVCQGWKTIQ